MDDPFELHDIRGYTGNADAETAYEIPRTSGDKENEYVKISTLSETLSEPIPKREDVEQRNCNVQISKPISDAAAIRKLTIFCFVLMGMVIISSGTTGVLIHTLMKRTDTTETKADDLQARLNQLLTKPGASTVLDSSTTQELTMKLQEMESRLEGKYDADFLVYSSKITQLEKDRIAHISLIQDHSSRITRLETGATVYEDNIQIFDARISKLEMDGLTDQRNIQSLNNGLNCSWGNWTSFSSCSASCGEGTQYRERRCGSLNTGFNGQWCSRRETELQACNIKPCTSVTVNGGWSSWSSWSACSRSCNGGVSSRQRTCTNPSPTGLGRPCIGNSDQVSICNGDPCPGHHIGFSAVGNTRTSNEPSTLTVIKFTKIKSNYGNGYSSSTGKFTCTYPGLYYFSASLIKERTRPHVDSTDCYIFRNSDTLIQTISNPTDDDTDYGSYETSVFIVVHLDRGDLVYVECLHLINFYSSFSGFLLMTD